MEAVRRTSSLPSGVFKAIDTNVETALTGPVADVFLTHMAASGAAASHDPARHEEEPEPEPNPRNRIEPEEIDAFMAKYKSAEPAAVPDLAHGLRCERMWVLTDLASCGSGRARELATRELRSMVGRMGSTDEFDLDVLNSLVEVIEPIETGDKSTVLLQVLLSSARQAIRQIEAQHD